MGRLWAALGIAVFLAGCATPYQPMGFGGGVESQQISADRFRIVARGNAYTSSTAIQDYVLLKAAETAKSIGATHFGIISSSDASRVSIDQSPGTATTSFYGRTAYTTFTPGASYAIFKPGQDVYIQVIKLKPNEAPPAGVMSAEEVIQFVGPRVKRAT